MAQVIGRLPCRPRTGGTATAAVLLVAAVALAGASPAAGDILRLTPKGVEAVRELGVNVRPSADGRAHVVQGRIIVRRDDADLPTLPEPGRYFLFQAGSGNQPSGANASARWEWAWVAEITHHHLDTLDDLRGMLSNRDKRYGSWAKELQALRADLDRGGTLKLRPAAVPPVTNPKIAPREGWLSRYLLHGPITPEDRTAAIRAARAKPKEDPTGYAPNDPLHWLLQPQPTMAMLLETIARARRYGEPEPGLAAAARELASFIGTTIYVPEASEVGPEAEKARRLRHFSLEGRAAILGFVEGVATPATSAHTPADDHAPLDAGDLAHAALDVLEGFVVPRPEDAGRVVDALLLASTVGATGPRAAKIVVTLSRVPSGASQDVGREFRTELARAIGRGDPGSAYVQAARETLVATGVGSEAEAKQVIDTMINLAFSGGPDDDPRLDDAVFVLKRLGAEPTSAAVRRRLTSYLETRIRGLAERQKDGSGGAKERRFLERWSGRP